MIGTNAFALLQSFVESERAVLQLFRKDIEATVEESLSESFRIKSQPGGAGNFGALWESSGG